MAFRLDDDVNKYSPVKLLNTRIANTSITILHLDPHASYFDLKVLYFPTPISIGKEVSLSLQKSVPFENSEASSIESRFADTHKRTSFLDITVIEKSSNTQWLFEAVDGFEFENGGVISFVPKKRFDGIITVYESGNPSFND